MKRFFSILYHWWTWPILTPVPFWYEVKHRWWLATLVVDTIERERGK